MAKAKDLEGSVSVEAGVTPITKQKIEQVEANQWSNMSVAELYDQRATLQRRLMYASQIGSMEMVKQLQRGLSLIDAVIATHSSEDGTGLI